MDLFMFSYIVLWVLVAIMAFILIGILHNIGVINVSLARLTGEDKVPDKLKVDELLPPINLETLIGDRVYLSEVNIAKSAITVVSPSCSPCNTFIKEIQEQDYEVKRKLLGFQKHIIICVGDRERAQLMVSALLVSQPPEKDFMILVDQKETSKNAWGINATPSTIITDNLGRVNQIFLGLFSERNFEPALGG